MSREARATRRAILGLVLTFALPLAAGAQQDNDSDQRLRRVRADIDRERGMAAAGIREAGDLLAEIEKFDARLLASVDRLAVLRAEEAGLEKNYSEALAALRGIDDHRRDASRVLTDRMAKIYRRGRLGSHRALAEAANSTEPLRMARYLAAIWLADKEATESYREARNEQRHAVEAIEGKRVASANSKKALEDESARYETARREKRQMLAKVRAEVGEHEVALKRLASDEDALKRLTGARGGAAPVAAVRSVLARLFIAQPEGAFSERKGRLEAPVRGALTGRYGDRLDGAGGQGLRGLLVLGRPAAGVSSVGDGEVVFAGPFPGLGNTVIVNHGERYHSVYARLGNISGEVGHKVDDGDRIGRLGRSDSILHFELRAEGRPLDPSEWFEGGYAAFRR